MNVKQKFKRIRLSVLACVGAGLSGCAHYHDRWVDEYHHHHYQPYIYPGYAVAPAPAYVVRPQPLTTYVEPVSEVAVVESVRYRTPVCRTRYYYYQGTYSVIACD